MKQHRSFSEWTVRLLCLLLGLYILAQGIAFTILANLGTDAITSPALVAHMVLGSLISVWDMSSARWDAC